MRTPFSPSSPFLPPMNRRTVLSAWLALSSPWATSLVQAQSPIFFDETWQDTRRQRVVPVRIRWPQGAAPAAGWPLVIYSHGLGGSRTGGDAWGEAWAAAGMVVVHLQHKIPSPCQWHSTGHFSTKRGKLSLESANFAADSDEDRCGDPARHRAEACHCHDYSCKNAG